MRFNLYYSFIIALTLYTTKCGGKTPKPEHALPRRVSASTYNALHTELVRRKIVSGEVSAHIFILRRANMSTQPDVLENGDLKSQRVVPVKYVSRQAIDKVFEGESLEPIKPALVDRAAIGFFDAGSGPCTAFHVGNGLVLSAGHCLTGDGSPGLISSFECTSSVTWSDGSKSTCDRGLYLQFDEARDFSVMHVHPTPQFSLRIRQNPLSVKEAVRAVGYPEGGTFKGKLVWSKPCESETSGQFPMSAWRTPSRFCHKCATEPGMSGAPVIDADGAVVGVHNGGLYTDDLNKLGWNIGTRIFQLPLQ
jgi:V8-like Glu-specific endopeptidase